MEQNNRPRGRETYVTSDSKGVHKRGDGLGTGPVGAAGTNPHTTQTSGQGRQSSTGTRAGGRGGLAAIILAAVVALGGGGGLISIMGNGGDSTGEVLTDTGSSYSSSYGQSTGSGGSASTGSASAGSGTSGSNGPTLINPFQAMSQSSAALNQSGSTDSQNLSTDVAGGSREKRTVIHGNGKDTVTIMVYMCGTDLESKYSMGTNDLLEMTKARYGENVNILVYTGGCKQWKNQVVSSSVNQIYQVVNGGLKCLVQNVGTDSMVKPATLTEFIRWCAQNYPANRNELILWDHGGGSVTGYGYDEKNPRAGSMTLAGIDKALGDAGVTFDFIGFDACLMATVETGLMLDKYADYMIASEETEPGIGWYYTDWLTALGNNTGMPTTEIGKNIVDGFIETCARQCRGQSCTLSVVDLAELSNTAPAALKDFSQSLSSMISNQEYSQISTARSQSREFARSSAIDQIDLSDFAQRLGTAEGQALTRALGGAVKYNRTSSDMSRCYGLSIYFPYRKSSSVDSAVSTYSAIGMDQSYSDAIRAFAQLEVSGQVATGGFDTSALGSLLGGYGGSSSSSSYSSADMITGLLGAFLGGGSGGMDFFSGRSMPAEDTVSYISDHFFDASALTWTESGDGPVLSLSDEQWSLVTAIDVNMFYDDGEGYVDLGLDNVYDFDDQGRLLGYSDGTWLAVNSQPIAFYHDYDEITDDSMLTYGTIPVLLNGQRAELLVVLEHGRGTVTGARFVYKDGETDTIAKSLTELSEGDQIDFVCDYYSYDGQYLDSYLLGETETWTGDWQINNVPVGEGRTQVTWRFTDIYNQHYWTEPIEG